MWNAGGSPSRDRVSTHAFIVVVVVDDEVTCLLHLQLVSTATDF